MNCPSSFGQCHNMPQHRNGFFVCLIWAGKARHGQRSTVQIHQAAPLLRPNSLATMADPLSIAASIIAVLQLTASVIDYLQSVHDARKDRIDFLFEVSGLYQLLLALQNRVDKANAKDLWLSQVRHLGAKDGPLDQFKSSLEHLVSKLCPREGFGRALIWKFNKGEIEGVISKIERIKTLVSLALTDDHLWVGLKSSVCQTLLTTYEALCHMVSRTICWRSRRLSGSSRLPSTRSRRSRTVRCILSRTWLSLSLRIAQIKSVRLSWIGYPRSTSS
jgi:hypothetical protein